MTMTGKDLHKTCHILYFDQNIASSFLICILKQEHGDKAKKRWSKRRNLRESVQLRIKLWYDTENRGKVRFLTLIIKVFFSCILKYPSDKSQQLDERQILVLRQSNSSELWSCKGTQQILQAWTQDNLVLT